MIEPWTVKIEGTENLSAVVHTTKLTVTKEKESWVGTAILNGAVTNKGNLSYEDALLYLLVILVDRDEDPDMDHWYIDEGSLLVRIEPLMATHHIEQEGDFLLTVIVDIDVQMVPSGVPEQEVADQVMLHIFTNTTCTVNDDPIQ